MVKFRCKYFKNDCMTVAKYEDEVKITILDSDNLSVSSVILDNKDIVKLKKELEKILGED